MTRGAWLRRVLVAGGLLCGLAPLEAQTLIQGTYREDAAHTSGDLGLFTLAVQRAIGSGLCGTAGDYCALQVDANGALHVIFTNTTLAVTNAGTFAVQAAQSGTWTVQPGNTANTTAWLVTGTGGTFPVTGTFWQATQPISAASLPLPTGASTAAKQPALGTAGSASTDVITVQGIASGTAVTVAGTVACSNCTGSGASAVDDAAFAVATDSVAPLGGLFDDTGPDSVNEGDEGAVRMSANRNLYTTLRDAAGNERGANVSAGNALLVDGSATTQPVSNAGLTELAAAIDTELQVDVVSSALPTGAATSAKQDTIIGHVDGIEGLLTTIDGDTGTIAGAVSGSEMQVDVVTSALPTGASTLAEQQTQTTALQLIDDIVRSEDTASAGGHAGAVVNSVRQDSISTTSSDDGDYQPIKSSAAGRLYTSATVDAALPAGNNNIGDVDIASGTVTANLGATDNAVLDDIADGIPVTNAGTFAVQDSTAQASLSVLDDWDESDRAKVNPIVGQAGVQGGAGAVSATTQRMALATDANAVDRTAVAAANNDGACISVDGTSDAILASFSTRRGATILNNGTVTFYLKLGATATTSDFPVAPGGVYNLGGMSVYTGAVDGITASSSTSVCVVEF